MRALSRFLLLAALLIGIPPTCASEPSLEDLPGRVVGRVVDDQGQALPGVKVSLESSEYPPKFTHSNADGQFEIESVPQGSYCIGAELFGFAPAADPLFVPAEQGVSYLFRLRAEGIEVPFRWCVGHPDIVETRESQTKTTIPAELTNNIPGG